MIIFLCGPAPSGKTSIAELVRAEIPTEPFIAHVESDDIMESKFTQWFVRDSEYHRDTALSVKKIAALKVLKQDEHPHIDLVSLQLVAIQDGKIVQPVMGRPSRPHRLSKYLNKSMQRF